jgi:magnesium-protoporphyrin O-methyltransferase
MTSCCNARGCDRTFNDRFARRMANRYRKKGLDKTAQRMVNLIAANDLAGATVLEVGGGVGEIQLELLKRGASRATNLELSEAYEAQAQQLLTDAGLADRVQRRIIDIAANPDEIEPADVVVLHRVVCCYPDYAKLLGAVADHARQQVVFSHPPRNLASRAVVGAQNLMFRLRGSEFRVFAHPPKAMLDIFAARGMHAATVSRSSAWHVSTAER